MPPAGCAALPSTLSKVVLPAPLRPTSPTLSRACTVNDTPSSRTVPPASIRRLRAWSTAQGYGAGTKPRHSDPRIGSGAMTLAPLPSQPDGVPWPTTEWPVGEPEVADPG